MLPRITRLALQHALIREIGKHAGLEPLLHSLLTACITRLSLAGAHIYLTTATHQPIAGDPPQRKPLAHTLTLPRAHTAPPHRFDVFNHAFKQHQEDPLTQPLALSEGRRHWHLFPLQTLGVVVLERFNTALTADIAAALQPVMDHLCQAIQHHVHHERDSREISRLANAEATAHANELRLRAVLDNSVDGIIITDEDGIIQSFNQAAQDMFGYPPGEIIGRNIQRLLNPTDTASNSANEKLNCGERGALVGYRKDGHPFPMELTFRDMRIGERRYFNGVARDATQYRQRERNLLDQLHHTQAIGRLAKSLGTQSTLSAALSDAAAIIGQTLQVDRAHVYHINLTDESITELASWPPNPTSTPSTEPPQQLLSTAQALMDRQRPLESHIHAIAPQLISGGSATLLHHRLGVQSLLLWPWTFDEGSLEFLALEHVERPHDWQTNEHEFLASATTLLSQKIAQLDLDQKKTQALAQAKLAAVAFHSHQAILITDATATIQCVNQAFSRVTGYASHEVVGKNPSILKSGRQDDAFYKRLWDGIQEKGYWAGEIWNRRKSGEVFPEWQSIAAVKNDDGEITHYVATFHDITERKQAEAHVKRLAYYDSLTGLPNRALLIDRLQQTLATAKRRRQISALLFLDLDRFKTINDSLGHSAGDTLLRQVAKRLKTAVRDEDTVARLGGDEFVVVLAQLNDTAREAGFTAQTIAERIRNALGEPYLLRGAEYQSKPSIGIALFPEESFDSADNILKHADTAMYRAKAAGGDAIRFYQPSMQAAADERLTMENALRYAVVREELLLHYQPQMDISGALVGAEALLRWQPEGRDLVSPVTFIPIAEETGHIIDIGEWVVRTAVRDFKRWLDNGILPADAVIAVNVSPRQFRQADLETLIDTVLRESGLPPRHLKIEITEGIVMSDINDTISKIENLRALGVGFSIDDFGTGYSSLAYLRRLPLSQLKIDKSFVQDITTDRNAAAIVETIISMAQHLNLDLIAEGVEQEDQMSFLTKRGCHRYQGYYFSRPLPAAQFETFAHNWKHRPDSTAVNG